MSLAILKNNEKLYRIKVNDKTFCSVGYTPGDALSVIVLPMPTDGRVTIEIQEEDLLVSERVEERRAGVVALTYPDEDEELAFSERLSCPVASSCSK